MFEDLFSLDVSAGELFLRTTIIYLVLVLAMRLLARREAGSLEIPDLLMVVLIADGVQNGMSGEYSTVTGAFIVGGTIIGWNYLLTVLMYRFSAVRRLLRPPPLLLVDHGLLLRQNMRKEFITKDEIMGMLRSEGVSDLTDVDRAYLEASGQLSVFKRDAGGRDVSNKKRRAAS